jgi:hypothetical protein
MKRVGLAVTSLVFAGLATFYAAVGAAADNSSAIIGFEDTGIDVGASIWVLDKTTGEMLPAPVGYVNDDPNQYNAFPQCQVDDGNLDITCLAGQRPCPPRADGKPGIPVVWKVAPRSIENPTWTDWQGNGGGPTCLYDRNPEDLLPRIAALIQREFDRLPINPGKLTAQPSPHTLRGAETNFYADAALQEFDITILAQRIHVIAKPVQYRWDYGDRSSLGPTTTMGGPLPQDRWGEKTRTSHAYAATGDFSVVLTTYFQGTYSVNGGPALPIPNQGQFSSAPQTVSVWRSVTRNYADDCITNPRGQGCPTR